MKLISILQFEWLVKHDDELRADTKIYTNDFDS